MGLINYKVDNAPKRNKLPLNHHHLILRPTSLLRRQPTKGTEYSQRHYIEYDDRFVFKPTRIDFYIPDGT